MASEVQQQFRRRFLRGAERGGVDLLLSPATPALHPDLPWAEAGERVLAMGVDSPDSLEQLADAVGAAGGVTALLESAAEVRRLGETLRGRWPRPPAPALRLECAEAGDLTTGFERIESLLRAEPVRDFESLRRFREALRREGERHPLIETDSIDRVLVEGLLNRLRRERAESMLREVRRALRPRGRILLGALVADEPPAGGGAGLDVLGTKVEWLPLEEELLTALEEAGFYGIRILGWPEAPRAVTGGAEIRAISVEAFIGKEGPCLERLQAVIYRGPWKQVLDDDNHLYRRGRRTAVCDKTFRILSSPPYRDELIPLPPYQPIAVEEAAAFSCHGSSKRSPSVTKGLGESEPGPDGGCC